MATGDWNLACDAKVYEPFLSPETVRDIEALDSADCGFCRDVSTDVKGCQGDLKKFTHHVVVVTDQAAAEWAPKLEGDTAAEVLLRGVTDALGKAPVKISIAEFQNNGVVRAGDVLVFASGAAPRVHRGVTAPTVPSLETLLNGGTALPDNSVFIMACAHTKRDARCGYAGPVLCDTARARAPGATVGKISHIGGHAYAGNLLVYDATGCDWFGYVNPANLVPIVKRDWSPEITRRWRGRLGATKEEHAKLVEQAVAETGGPTRTAQLCKYGVLAAIAAGLYTAHVQKGWRNPQ